MSPRCSGAIRFNLVGDFNMQVTRSGSASSKQIPNMHFLGILHATHLIDIRLIGFTTSLNLPTQRSCQCSTGIGGNLSTKRAMKRRRLTTYVLLGVCQFKHVKAYIGFHLITNNRQFINDNGLVWPMTVRATRGSGSGELHCSKTYCSLLTNSTRIGA